MTPERQEKKVLEQAIGEAIWSLVALLRKEVGEEEIERALEALMKLDEAVHLFLHRWALEQRAKSQEA